MSHKSTLFSYSIFLISLSVTLGFLAPNLANAQQNKKVITNEDFGISNSTNNKSEPKEEYKSLSSKEIKMPISGFVFSVPSEWETGICKGNLLGLGVMAVGIQSIAPKEEIGFIFTDLANHKMSLEQNIDGGRKLFQRMKKQTENKGGIAEVKETKINGFFVITIELAEFKRGSEEKSIGVVFFKDRDYLFISNAPSRYYDKYKATINEILNSVK
jgi:hypothetical protein